MTPSRLIDTWFPCAEVDAAAGAPAGSGLSEKALFTWFASRPIAQARAATLCSLLPDDSKLRNKVQAAVGSGDAAAMGLLRSEIGERHGPKGPVVLDMFSGRGILSLEAVRAGAHAIGLDLSPVATLAGRLLADFPRRDWSAEPVLPFKAGTAWLSDASGQAELDVRDHEPRLVADVRTVLAEVGLRVRQQVSPLYSSRTDEREALPWAYLWAVTIPCDACARRFPLISSLVLRHPYGRTGDKGQSLELICGRTGWTTRVTAGTPRQQPTYLSPSGKRGKSARCPFTGCGHIHNLDIVKAKGLAGQYRDAMLAVASIDPETRRKVFRAPLPDETTLAGSAASAVPPPLFPGLPSIPHEVIPRTAGVDARQYGFLDYGALMNQRQAVVFAITAQVVAELHRELTDAVSIDYAGALTAYAAAGIARQLRRATRGSRKESRGKPDGSAQNRVYSGDLFTNQSTLAHAFDYLEAGPGTGPGTWASISEGLLNALRKVMAENRADTSPARFRQGTAVALPFRDGTIDAIVTDPPYYDMIAYSDSSDLFFVWLKRALREAVPDLFGVGICGQDGLQDKRDEIIVKGRGAKGLGDHRTHEHYESMLARSFAEARRVLKPNGQLTVIFGHSDPDAWRRLLSALTEAGFVVTSSWPSRTETAVTGVATISVTVSIGTRVAPPRRPVGIAAQVDADVTAQVKARCRIWDEAGLALDDQLMASYGAALEVVGGYRDVITPDGTSVTIERYMTLARRAVRDAVALRLDEMPLETFDPHTRLAIFWHEVHGRLDVPKGEARFFTQSDGLRLEDLRGPILNETRAGFRLRHDSPGPLRPEASAYEVVRGMAAAWAAGTDAVAACLLEADRPATDAHVWALVDWLRTKLPDSDPVAVSLTAVRRNRASVQAHAALRISTPSPALPSPFQETV